MSGIDLTRPGPWASLFPRALKLMAHLEQQISDAHWTFGGGTVLMYRGRTIRVETSAEIIAKKMWHRGDRAKARDLYDLCAVAVAEPAQLKLAQPFMIRHGAKFLQALVDSEDVLRRQFAEIDVIGRRLDFDRCAKQAKSIIEPLLR